MVVPSGRAQKGTGGGGTREERGRLEVEHQRSTDIFLGPAIHGGWRFLGHSTSLPTRSLSTLAAVVLLCYAPFPAFDITRAADIFYFAWWKCGRWS